MPEEAESPPEKGWISLFNCKHLDGWTPKIKGYPAGENYADIFRVEDGVLKVSTTSTRSSTGTSATFYKTPFRITGGSSTGSSASSAPAGRAGRSRNSGVMIHGQIAREHAE